MAERVVHTIPATVNRFTASPIMQKSKRKVAGYARVSTDMEEQLTSYDAQVKYYTDYIKIMITGSLSECMQTRVSQAQA